MNAGQWAELPNGCKTIGCCSQDCLSNPQGLHRTVLHRPYGFYRTLTLKPKKWTNGGLLTSFIEFPLHIKIFVLILQLKRLIQSDSVKKGLTGISSLNYNGTTEYCSSAFTHLRGGGIRIRCTKAFLLHSQLENNV